MGSMASRHTQPTHQVYIKGPNNLEQEMFESWVTGLALEAQKTNPGITWTYFKLSQSKTMKVNFSTLDQAVAFKEAVHRIKLPTEKIHAIMAAEQEEKIKSYEENS